MESKRNNIIHVGCGNIRHEGMTNLTKEDLDITKPWPYEDNSVDGIVSQQVLQQIEWRGLIKALKEMYRVLRDGGVMRFGTMLIEDNTAEQALGWNNINLFSFDLLKRVLEEVGFTDVRIKKYQDSDIEEFKKVDNRPHKGSSYIECIKL